MNLINLIAKATFLYKLSQTDKNKIINDVYKKTHSGCINIHFPKDLTQDRLCKAQRVKPIEINFYVCEEITYKQI